jgi:hypothetical protein
MPYTEYTKHQLAPYITGDLLGRYRRGSDLVALFNTFGFRDLYQEGLPMHPRRDQRMSRTEYVRERLGEMNDVHVSGLLTRVISESDNSELLANGIKDLILPDGFDVTENNGNWFINGGVINKVGPVINQAHFLDIENRILHVLDEARVSIVLVMAWFTNENLRNKLLEKLEEGLDIRIALYDDGINNRHGVDLMPFNPVRLRRALRGGIMHDKFCVVDNQIVITGSYNWTSNAEFRNDENITIERDPEQATRFSVEFRRLTRHA